MAHIESIRSLIYLEARSRVGGGVVDGYWGRIALDLIYIYFFIKYFIERGIDLYTKYTL